MINAADRLMVLNGQEIVDCSIATQKGEYYEAPRRGCGPSDINDILRMYRTSNNPVTKSVLRDIFINRVAAGELENLK